MANYIEYSTLVVPEIYVVPTSRYLSSSVVYYGDEKKISFSMYKRADIPVSPDDKYMLITAGYEYRPDLVSQKAYSTPDYWWRIMEANKIYDVLDFKAGLTVRIPVNFSSSYLNG